MHPGEVVGLAGLLGSGRTETARLLFGADRADTGTVTIGGEPVRLRNPRIALGQGIAFASENRRTEGLIGDLSVRANIVLAMQAARGWTRAIPRRQQDELADQYIKALDIRPADPEAMVANLSGGNQQKVLLARWLLTAPKLLILDEPTRGIDVGAKAEIQRLVAALSDEGMAVVFISAELEEVLRLSHRIGVMRDRHKVAEIVNREHHGDDLMQLIAEGAETGRCGDSTMKAIVAAPAVLAAGHPRRPAGRHAPEVADLLRHHHPRRQPVRQPDQILRRAAPTLLVALGMTLVIATRGIDLSVGAVAAISGAGRPCSSTRRPPECGRHRARRRRHRAAAGRRSAACGTGSSSPSSASSPSSPRSC